MFTPRWHDKISDDFRRNHPLSYVSAPVSFIALAVGLAASSPCIAQTMNLGQAGQYNVFETTMPGVSSGSLYIQGSSIDGSVALGTGTAANFYADSSAIGGALYGADSSFPEDALVHTTIAGGVQLGTDLSQATSDAASAAAVAAGLANNNTSFSEEPTGQYSVTGQSSMNVFSFDQGLSLLNTTFTINGTSSQQFVFNFDNLNPDNPWDALNLENTTIVLNGVSASNVFFNVIGGTVSIWGSAVSGTILDEVGSDVNIGDSTIHGHVIGNGDISILNSSIAPELSTIMTAALACVLVAGNAGRIFLRQRRFTLAVAPSSL